MRLFFRNIPADTSPKELARYIKPSLDNGIFKLFKTPGKIIKIEIFEQIDPDSNVVRRHGLVTIGPEKVAKRAMKRLHRVPLKGRIILVREFNNRSGKNNRRKYSPKNVSLQNNRRIAERRLHILEKVTHFGITFSDRPQFSRKFES